MWREAPTRASKKSRVVCSTSMSVERWYGFGRIVIGGSFVLIGLLRLINPSTYPAGDYRGDPTFWAASNGAAILLGILIAAYGLRPFMRNSD